MKCKYCGEEIPESAKFCTNCGKKVIDNVSSEDKISLNEKDYRTKKSNLKRSDIDQSPQSLQVRLKKVNKEKPYLKYLIAIAVVVLAFFCYSKAKSSAEIDTVESSAKPIVTQIISNQWNLDAKCTSVSIVRKEDNGYKANANIISEDGDETSVIPITIEKTMSSDHQIYVSISGNAHVSLVNDLNK